MNDKRKPLDFEYIQSQATGYYLSRIFPAVGINLKGNGKKHQPCPLCGGNDRFRCDDKDGAGTWICNQCGAGNGYTLVREYTRQNAYDTHATIAEILGIDGGKSISEADKKTWQAQQKQREATEKQAKAQARTQAANQAQARWQSASPASTHPYLTKKQVSAHGLRADSLGLLIPMYYHNTNTGNITLCNVQSINDKGDKLFVKGGLVGGAFYTIGTPTIGTGVILLAEGYATAASIYEALGGAYPVIVTFDAGNMVKCSHVVRALYPQHRLIFCADNDRKTAESTGKNTGIIKANEAASIARGEVIIPDFGDDARTLTGELTDYNDLAVNMGQDVLRAQLVHALNRAPQAVSAPISAPTPPAKAKYTLEKILKNFAIIKTINGPTNKIYHLSAREEMTKTQFAAEVGDKALAEAWHQHADRQSIDREQVQSQLGEKMAERYSSIFEQYWYIQGTKEVFNHKTRKRQLVETLRLEYPNHFDMWNKSDSRQKVEQDNIWFDPSGLRRPAYGENYINTFDGLPLSPFSEGEIAQMMGVDKPTQAQTEGFLLGMVSPLIELIRHLSGADASDAVLHWVLDWLAIPLQNLGTKMDTGLIVHGHIQGAGKSLFFDRILRRIYGNYALTLGQGQLESQYNDWVEGKLFVVFEEIFQGKDRWGQGGMVKQLITGDSVYISKKFISGYKQDNFVNTVFLSNDLQPQTVEMNDRRFVVLYPEAVMPQGIKQAVSEALADEEELLVRAFYSYLLIKRVNPTVQRVAIDTKAKADLQLLSMASWERFYYEWKNGTLDAPYRTCLSQDLYRFYCYWCKQNGEKSTSGTKFGVYIGKHELKKVVRYQINRDISGTKINPIIKQAHVIVINFGDKIPDQNWYGDAIISFKRAIAKYMNEEKPA